MKKESVIISLGYPKREFKPALEGEGETGGKESEFDVVWGIHEQVGEPNDSKGVERNLVGDRRRNEEGRRSRRRLGKGVGEEVGKLEGKGTRQVK